jgi:HSP20 family molecular chaperone IbpA
MTAADPRNWMWAEACVMIERAERLHRQFFEPGLGGLPEANWEPPVDIFGTDRELWIIAALPGVEPDDLEVSLEADSVLVTGLRRLPAVARGANIHRLEIPHGRFERRIRLPHGRLELDRSDLSRGCLFLHLTKQI